MQTLVFLILFIVFGWLLWRAWRVYQATFVARRMDMASREQALLAEHLAPGLPAVALPKAPAAPAMLAPPAVAANKPRRLLNSTQRTLLSMLRMELRGHEIMAAVDIARLCGSDSLPPRVHIDFLVCDKHFTPLCAIFLMPEGGDPLRERATQLLGKQGLRVLRWQHGQLPSREELATQTLG